MAKLLVASVCARAVPLSADMTVPPEDAPVVKGYLVDYGRGSGLRGGQKVNVLRALAVPFVMDRTHTDFAVMLTDYPMFFAHRFFAPHRLSPPP